MDNNTSNKKQNLLPFIIAIVLAGGIFLGYVIGMTSVNKPSVFSNYEYNKIEDVLNYIENNYVDSLNRADIEERAIAELLADLDPHSYYIPAEETQSIAEDMQGNFEGIGVQFRILRDTILIENTIEGGPSEKVGIQAGDKIIFVQDSLVAGVGVTNADVMLLLKGPKGTKVNVKVLRKGKVVPYTITRDKIPLYSVDATFMLNKTTGYIKVNRFAATTYEEFVDGILTLKKEGMIDLVLDLRGNPGGYLQAAVEMTDELLAGKKLVVYTEGLHQEKYEYTTSRNGVFEEGQLIVLIDQNSASASEIMAGAIQDWDRGIILGRRSFGKGLVQDQHEFPDKSALRLTIARYFTPTGRSIQKSYEDKDAYFSEVDLRYENGELLGLDSNETHQDTIKYYTLVKKREVYGGGGITPDVFMPLDTSYANLYVAQLRQYILPFLYEYAETNRTTFEKYSVDTFVKGFRVDAKMYGEFQDFARADGYTEAFSENKDYNEGLKLLIKANLGKQLFQNEGFYKVITFDSPIINEALKQLGK